MRTSILFFFSVLLALSSRGQSPKMLQQEWIKSSIENLSNRETAQDTLYTRYTFRKSSWNVSFDPGWDYYTQSWSMNGKNLTLGFDTYRIEELNDTSLTIALDGFRRMKFLSEAYLSTKEEHLDSLGQYNNKPFYKANHYITPRFKGKENFRDFVQKDLEGFNIRKANYFLATFIVTEEGKVENVIIRNGITEGFDAAATKQLYKSSGKWAPARFKGKPIQTEMKYAIKYLDSITPQHSGVLNE